MLIIDTVSLGDARTTADGYLVADAKIARTGIQQYRGDEMGRPDLSVVRVYRPEDEVFSKDALASMAHRPITVNHPTEAVTAANWKQHSVGQVGGEVARDGDHVRVPLVLMDQGAIDAVQAGKRQLSVGYSADIDWTAGVTADGHAYDAVQRRIRGNHLAIVDQARAGPACRIGDGWSAPQDVGDRDMPDLKKITLDGLTIDVTDQVVEKLQKDAADAKAALADAGTAHKAALDAKDGEITALKAKLADAEMTPAKLDAAVAARAKVIGDARKIAGDKLVVDGKTDVEIRRAAVAAKIGDAAAKDMTDAAIEGAFRVLAPAGNTSAADPLRSAIGDTQPVNDARAEALRKRDERLSNAWKGKAA